MICFRCGAYVKDGIGVCPACGQKLNNTPNGQSLGNYQNYQNRAGGSYQPQPQVQPMAGMPAIQTSGPQAPPAPKKKNPLKWIIPLCVAATVLLFAGAGAYFWFFNPAAAFDRALEQGNYPGAAVQFDKMSAQNREAALEKLTDRARGYVVDYRNERATYDAAEENCSALEAAFPMLKNRSGYKAKVTDQLDALRSVRDHTAMAAGAESRGDLPWAISEYEEAAAQNAMLDAELRSAEDPEKKVEELKSTYREEVLTQADVLTQSGNYEGALAALQKGLECLPDDEALSTHVTGVLTQMYESEVTELLEQTDHMVENGEYAAAIAVLESSDKLNDDRVSARLENYKNEYERLQREEEARKEEEARREEEARKAAEAAQALANSRAPFYGIWCGAFNVADNATRMRDNLRQAGYDARIFLTTDWSNLNSNPYQVVTAGLYATREQAEAVLPAVRQMYPTAYIKYSGDYQG